jgi:hypothetical protein
MMMVGELRPNRDHAKRERDAPTEHDAHGRCVFDTLHDSMWLVQVRHQTHFVDSFGCFFPWQCKLYRNFCGNVLLRQPKQHTTTTTTITTMTTTTDLANNSDHLQTTNSCLSLSMPV